MSYVPIQYANVPDTFLREEVFRRADLLLGDVYAMFSLEPEPHQGGNANWSIALVLLCVIDGLSIYLYPTLEYSGKQDVRFKKLIRDKLYWATADDSWYDKAKAAAVLYTEFRNPLVHELAAEKIAKARPAHFRESAVGKWGFVQVQDIQAIEGMATWNDSWPTLGVEDYADGQRLKLSCASLYWSVKKMTNDLADDANIIEKASLRRQDRRKVRSVWSQLWRRIRG